MGDAKVEELRSFWLGVVIRAIVVSEPGGAKVVGELVGPTLDTSVGLVDGALVGLVDDSPVRTLVNVEVVEVVTVVMVGGGSFVTLKDGADPSPFWMCQSNRTVSSSSNQSKRA